MIIIESIDVQNIIVSYLNNIKDLLAWRHICHNTMNIFTAQFIYHRFSDIFNIIGMTLLYDDNTFAQNVLKYGYTLIYLDCGYNNTIYNISMLHNLIVLKCSYNEKIKILPTKIKNLSCGCNSKILDSSIIKLLNLQVLKCDFNTIITHNSICTLINLVRIEFGINVNATDETFKMLTKVRILKCGSNKLTDRALSYLPNLEQLNCGIRSIFTNVGLSYIPKLHTLKCGFSTNFTDDGFKYSKELLYLNCDSSSNLTNTTLIHIPKLILLNCGNNHNFTDEGILRLPNLKLLYPKYNKNFSRKILNMYKKN